MLLLLLLLLSWAPRLDDATELVDSLTLFLSALASALVTELVMIFWPAPAAVDLSSGREADDAKPVRVGKGGWGGEVSQSSARLCAAPGRETLPTLCP